jgi:CDP-6-deoxy-D-xylo-4-hexulose-3-dehydrase
MKLSIITVNRNNAAGLEMILAVNLLGNPNDFAKINAMISNTNIILLEDNCESLGATFDGKKAGTFGVMGTYSSFFSHHISTMEGGMIVTDDEELYQILLCTRSHGWTRNLPENNLISTPKVKKPRKEIVDLLVKNNIEVRPIVAGNFTKNEECKIS